MRVLVTGGAGYIGSVVVAQLLEAGHDIVVYDNLSKGHRESVPSKVPLVVADVGDAEKLGAVIQRHSPRAVMHFAASIEAGESMQHPAKYFRNNTANTLNLLDTMQSHGVRGFVFSSTAAVYGNPKSTPIRESDALEPANAYGESKLLVERMLNWFHRIHELSYVSLRYFNASGATAELGEMHRPETHLIPIVLQVAEGKRDHVSIFGADYPTDDGTCVRDYIHVADLADAHVRALEALGRATTPVRHIYNLGNGRGFSVRQVISTAERVVGKRIAAVEADRRAGDPAVLVASSEKIQNELGWRPRHADLESIIGSAWQWVQTQSRAIQSTGA